MIISFLHDLSTCITILNYFVCVFFTNFSPAITIFLNFCEISWVVDVTSVSGGTCCFWRYTILNALFFMASLLISLLLKWWRPYFCEHICCLVLLFASLLLLGPCCCFHLCCCGIPLPAIAESPFCCLRPWCFCWLCCTPCFCRCSCLCPWCFEFLLTFLLFLAFLLHARAGYFLFRVSTVHDPAGVLIVKAFLAVFWYCWWCPFCYWRPCCCWHPLYCRRPFGLCPGVPTVAGLPVFYFLCCWSVLSLFCSFFCLLSVPALAGI